MSTHARTHTHTHTHTRTHTHTHTHTHTPNSFLILAAPTPTNISSNSEPETKKKGTSASPAIALASRVLPVPGGPINRSPADNLISICMYITPHEENLLPSLPPPPTQDQYHDAGNIYIIHVLLNFLSH